MDAAKIQAKVYRGYGQAAKRISPLYDQFRPFAASPALYPTNKVGQVNASMTVGGASNFNFERALLLKDYLAICLSDGRALMPGDYLRRVSDGIVYFIGGMEPLLPIAAVRCNAVIALRRRANQALSAGSNSYQAPILAQESPLIEGIPALVTLVSSGRNTHGAGLPSDAPGPIKFTALLSLALVGLMPEINEFIYDDMGRRFMIDGVDKTPIALLLDLVHEVS